MASVVIFRVFFGIAHSIKWQFRYAFNKNYAINEYNLDKNFKKIKQMAKYGGESTDDEIILEKA